MRQLKDNIGELKITSTVEKTEERSEGLESILFEDSIKMPQQKKKRQLKLNLTSASQKDYEKGKKKRIRMKKFEK